jgi:hypothetical protein
VSCTFSQAFQGASNGDGSIVYVEILCDLVRANLGLDGFNWSFVSFHGANY